MNLLVLPRYGRLGASSRLRSFQFLPYLERAGISVETSPLLDDAYVRSLSTHERALGSIVRGGVARLSTLLRSRRFDAIYLEKEALPWFPALIELPLLARRPRLVVDFDDAVFHSYDQHRSAVVQAVLGHKIDDVMRRADMVTVGNDYLGQRARDAGCRRVEWLPTVVDLDRYPKLPRRANREGPIVVGWIGSPSTAQHLAIVSKALERVGRDHAVRCVAIGARPEQLRDTPFESLPWSEASEFQSLRRFDIGIMPLFDTPFDRGKCGYKLVQYMASGLPVIASPVGVNRDIVLDGKSGFLADSTDDWERALRTLVADAELRTRMGEIGRERVEAIYSAQVQGPRFVALLREVMEG